MNVQFPKTQAEWEAFVKENVWTILVGLLALIALWQGLTLFTQVRSWRGLQDRVETVIAKEAIAPVRGDKSTEDEGKRSLDETFFYRPNSTYKITAIFDDRAIVNGKEIKVGDRLEKATVEKIEVNAVTLKVEGEDNPKRIELHPGL